MSGCPRDNNADNLAEDLSLKLYDLGWLMKAWFGCFLSVITVQRNIRAD